MNNPKMRQQIEHAHTLLSVGLQLQVFTTAEDVATAKVALNVLCWALSHQHANPFARVIDALDLALSDFDIVNANFELQRPGKREVVN